MEVLDAPGFIDECGFMGGIEGWIEPGQLKRKVETVGFGEWLKGRDVELQGPSESQFKGVKK
jgi:hypothetical protein